MILIGLLNTFLEFALKILMNLLDLNSIMEKFREIIGQDIMCPS